MKKTRVMIVDDQMMPRKLFEMYIQSSDKYELTFSLETAAFADVYLLKNEVDVILMDILMADGSNGLDAAEQIRMEHPDIKIIAVTSMPEYSWMERAREIGIESFWYKESGEETILNILDRTMAGESVYPDDIPAAKIGMADVTELTKRELDVLKAVTTGDTNGEIGRRLGMTEGTVKTHINHMLIKTGCRSRTELAVKARVSGIVIDLETE